MYLSVDSMKRLKSAFGNKSICAMGIISYPKSAQSYIREIVVIRICLLINEHIFLPHFAYLLIVASPLCVPFKGKEYNKLLSASVLRGTFMVC